MSEEWTGYTQQLLISLQIMSLFICNHCHKDFSSFGDIIHHGLSQHPDENLECLETFLCDKTGTKKTKKYDFQAIPSKVYIKLNESHSKEEAIV